MEEEETKRLLDEEEEVSDYADEEENSEELQGMTKAKEKEKDSSLVVTLSEFLADAPPPKMPPKAAKLFYGTPSPLPESFHKERRDRVFTAYENREKYPVGFPGFPLRLAPPSKSSTYPKSSTTADESLPPLPPRPTKIYVSSSNESVVYATDDEDEGLIAMILFIVGFCLPCIWCFSSSFLRSESSKARCYGLASLIMIILCSIVILLAVAGVVCALVLGYI